MRLGGHIQNFFINILKLHLLSLHFFFLNLGFPTSEKIHAKVLFAVLCLPDYMITQLDVGNNEVKCSFTPLNFCQYNQIFQPSFHYSEIQVGYST